MTYLRNSAKLTLTFIIVLFFLLSFTPSYAEDYSCLNRALSPARVIRIDGTAIFAVVKDVSKRKVEKSIPEVKKCLQAGGWGGDIWSIVYFSDKKYAVYTTELETAKVRFSDWKKAYLALYEHSKGKLTLRPENNPEIYYLDPPKK